MVNAQNAFVYRYNFNFRSHLLLSNTHTQTLNIICTLFINHLMPHDIFVLMVRSDSIELSMFVFNAM